MARIAATKLSKQAKTMTPQERAKAFVDILIEAGMVEGTTVYEPSSAHDGSQNGYNEPLGLLSFPPKVYQLE